MMLLIIHEHDLGVYYNNIFIHFIVTLFSDGDFLKFD